MSQTVPENTVPEGTVPESGHSGSPGSPGADGWGDRRLPGPLAERFHEVGELAGGGGQARVYRVRDQDGQERFLKIYNRAPEGLDEVWAALEQATGPHIVKPVETGRAAGNSYEVAEFVSGGSLRDVLRERGRLGVPLVKEVVRQVTEALAELHDLGVRHRDIKPDNILIRGLDPIDTALTDFGISRRTEDRLDFTESHAGSPRYMPPEWPDAVSPDVDFWALGMTVAELAVGTHLLEFEDVRVVRMHVNTEPIDVSPVEDPDLRLLCAGLLVRNPDLRWGAEEIERWQAGEAPRVETDEWSPAGVVRPIRFGGNDHRTPEMLAAALSRAWEPGMRWVARNREELAEWLEQFPALDRNAPMPHREFLDALRRSADPPDVRHLRLLRRLNPLAKPYYRGVRITPGDVANIAARAAGDEPAEFGEIVADLWRHGLLADLDAAQGGSGLAALHARWRERAGRWEALVARLRADPAAARALREIDPDLARAHLLLLTCSGPGHRERLRHRAREVVAELAERRTPVAWFTDLAVLEGDVAALAAMLTGAAALAESDAMVREWREYAARRRVRAWTEWFDRNQRTTALGWAAMALLVIAVAWVIVMTASDLIPRVPDQQIALGWVFCALCVLVIAATEIPFAAWAGAEYDPGFSLLADLIDVGAFLAHPLRGNRWLALAGIAGGIAVLGAGMAYVPPALPVVATVAHLWRLRVRAGHWQESGEEPDEHRENH